MSLGHTESRTEDKHKSGQSRGEEGVCQGQRCVKVRGVSRPEVCREHCKAITENSGKLANMCRTYRKLDWRC